MKPKKESLARFLGLVGVVGLILVAHLATSTHATVWHNIFQRLYYAPILAAAYWFGLGGAVAISMLAAASYLPHIMSAWQDWPAYREAQYAELVMFQVVAISVGALVHLERRQRRQKERTAAELEEAHRKLQESFEDLKRADRLSILGQLSAGLAHEIKNPLASMKGSLEILASGFPPGHPKQEFVEILDKEISRLDRVLGEFLQFARPPRPDPQPCNLLEVVDSIRLLCSKEADRRGVRLDVDCSNELPHVYADAGQIQQALLNIVLNGIQAMPSGGRLEIGLSRTDSCIHIRVHDEGPGIPPEHRSRIFEPFFTTRERGTGLGLAIARKLIEGHRGEIRLQEEERLGTTFVVTLPIESYAHD